MDWSRSFALIVRLLVVVTCAAVPASAAASEQGEVAVKQVTEESYRYFLGDNQGVEGILYTHAGDNRGLNGPEHDLARDNIAEHFETYGLSVVLEPFQYAGTRFNVVATNVGILYPEQEFIVGAHYDSVNNPGADDNASGVALVLEAARILSQYESDYTIRFIAFDAEEQGLVGSEEYVYAHSGDDILGMISADMVAYNTGANSADIHGRSASNPLKTALADAITTYGDGLGFSIQGSWDASDHAPFEWAGYQACLLIEDWGNPYYHTQNDNVDMVNYIDYAFAVRMTRSVVGFLVDAAGVHVDADILEFSYPDGRPEFVAPGGGTMMRVVVTGLGEKIPQPGTGVLHYDVGYGWESVPMEVVSENVYDAAFPPADCGQEVRYYVSAEATDGEVFTSPWNAPSVSYWAYAAWGWTVLWENSLDADPGWTAEGQWAFGQPTGGGGYYHGYPDPTSGATGSNVYGANLDGDYSTVPGGPYYLTTGPIDLSEAVGPVSLEFQRWLNTDYPPYVSAMIEVSPDGVNWYSIWSNGGEIADNAWMQREFDLTAILAGQSTAQVRWGYEIGDGAWAYSGWNIDDVQLISLLCAPPCPGDLDGDNDVDLADLAQLLGNFGQTTGMTYEDGDLDGDGDVDLSDLAALLAVYGTTCP